ncbi:MAG: putative pre-rrna processing protein [Streblomastix strix]|uniref:Putative pre-rrna processing protein n=1 Tax=Streblomastix strix TaxID=222440 RepID=A0A5J4XA08_9EUKA|nr:MAG: putative pre-rrna processing protein [Streblomastix strix]
MSSQRIIVFGLPDYFQDEGLRQHFSSFAAVTDASIKRKTNGKSRQFGFVGFKDEVTAQNAVNHFNKTFVNTSRITVELAKPVGDVSISIPKSNKSQKRKEFFEKQKDIKDQNDVKDKDKRKKKGKESKEANKDENEKDKELRQAYQRPSTKPSWMNDDEQKQNNEREGKVENKEKKRKGKKEQKRKEDQQQNNNIKEEIVFDDDDNEDDEEQAIFDPDDVMNTKMKDNNRIDQEEEDEDEEEEDDDIMNMMKKKRKREELDVDNKDDEQQEQKDEDVKIQQNEEQQENVNNLNKSIDRKQKKLDTQIKVANEDASLLVETGRLYVTNIPYDANEEEIGQYFKRFGEMSEIRILRDFNTKKAKGQGFISFTRPIDALKAYMYKDGMHVFQGRIIHLAPAEKEIKMMEDEQEKQGKLLSQSFKQKRLNQIKKRSLNEEVWSSVTVGENHAVGAVADIYGVNKRDILNIDELKGDGSSQSHNNGQNNQYLWNKGQSIASRAAIAQSEVVNDTKQYLQQEGIDMNIIMMKNEGKQNVKGNVNSPQIKRSDRIIIIKNLGPNTDPKELERMFTSAAGNRRPLRFIMPPTKVIALIEFSDEDKEGAKKAFNQLVYKRYGDAPLYLEWAPEGVFMNQNGQEDEKNEQRKRIKEREGEEDNDIEHGIFGRTLFMKGIPFKSTEQIIKQEINKRGYYPVSVSIPKRKKKIMKKLNKMKKQLEKDNEEEEKEEEESEIVEQSMGFCFIEFKSKDETIEAMNALKSHLVLDGRVVEVSLSHATQRIQPSIQISNSTSSQSDLDDSDQLKKSSKGQQSSSQQNQITKETFGDEYIHIPPSHSIEDTVKGENININKEKEQIQENKKKKLRTKLLVKNIAFQTTQQDIKSLFSVYGTIKSIRLPKKHDGQLRGFGFVEFGSGEECRRAMEQLGQVHLYGRHLVIEYADDDASNNLSDQLMSELTDEGKEEQNYRIQNQSQQKNISSSLLSSHPQPALSITAISSHLATEAARRKVDNEYYSSGRFTRGSTGYGDEQDEGIRKKIGKVLLEKSKERRKEGKEERKLENEDIDNEEMEIGGIQQKNNKKGKGNTVEIGDGKGKKRRRVDDEGQIDEDEELSRILMYGE